MRERTKKQIERILDNFNRQLEESRTNKKIDKNMLVAGTLMKLMRIVIRQLDEVQKRLDDNLI